MSTSPSLSDSDSGPPTARGTRRPRGGSSSPESGSAFDDSDGGDEATSSSSGDEGQVRDVAAFVCVCVCVDARGG